ncbi:MAG: tetratricopeptide repeat protein [Candidatus Nealsonbacteria bacterium]
MEEKINIQKAFLRTPLLIAIIFFAVVIAGVGYGIFDYQKLSGIIEEAERLAGEEKYDEAIEKLEFAQQKWIVKNLSVKSEEIERSKQLIESQRNYNEGIKKIKTRDWNEAKELLLSVAEESPYYLDTKNKIEILEEVLDCKYRKGEYKMRVFDSQGRVTGIVDGEVKEEIPYSVYDEETKQVLIFDPNDSYTYDFSAVKAGNYQFILTATRGGETTSFHLENIPILSGATHRIQVDEKAVAEGKMGAVLLMDDDGDGEFEEEITFSKELTCEGFIIRTKMPEIELETPEEVNVAKGYMQLAEEELIEAKKFLEEDKTFEASKLIAQAIKDAKIAADSDPDNPEMWFRLGNIYCEVRGTAQGAEEWCLRYYQKALELDPDNQLYYQKVEELTK